MTVNMQPLLGFSSCYSAILFLFRRRKEAVLTRWLFTVDWDGMNWLTYNKHLSVMCWLIPYITHVLCAGWEMGLSQIHHPSAPHPHVCHHPGTVFLLHVKSCLISNWILDMWFTWCIVDFLLDKYPKTLVYMFVYLVSVCQEGKRPNLYLFQEEEMLTGKWTSGCIVCINTLFWIFFPELVSDSACLCLLIFQTAYIPDELYKRVYDLCKRLLTYPHPYCTVGLSYTRQIKTERFIPGIIYLQTNHCLNHHHCSNHVQAFYLLKQTRIDIHLSSFCYPSPTTSAKEIKTFNVAWTTRWTHNLVGGQQEGD